MQLGSTWGKISATAIVLLFLTGGLFVVAVQQSSPSQPSITPQSTSLDILASALSGPFNLPPQLGEGAPDSVSAALDLDVADAPLVVGLAQYTARHQPRAPPPMQLDETPSLADLVSDPILGLPAAAQDALAWRLELFPDAELDPLLNHLLAAHRDLKALEETIRRDVDRSHPGGSAQLLLDLAKDAAGEELPLAAQNRLKRTVERQDAERVLEHFQKATLLQAQYAQREDQVRRAFEEAGVTPPQLLGPQSPLLAAQELVAQIEAGGYDRPARVIARAADQHGFPQAPLPALALRTLPQAIDELARVAAVPLTPADREAAIEYAALLDPRTERFLADVVSAYVETLPLVEKSVENVSPEDAAYVLERISDPESATTIASDARMKQIGLTGIDRQAQWRSLYVASARLEAAVAGYSAPQSDAAMPLFIFPDAADPLLVIGGPRADHYQATPLLNIDLGGDDVYSGAIGGSSYPITGGICIGLCPPLFPPSVPNVPRSLGISIDLEGDDHYKASGGWDDGALGGGMYGAGIHFDLAGDDRYEPDTTVSLGTGTLGAGLLFDASGDDLYQTPGSFGYGLGSGIQGIGLTLDREGDDTYRISGYGLGAGLIGSGAFADIEGDDVYEAASAFIGLGSGLLGHGTFLDGGGADRYDGGSYTMGSGIQGAGEFFDLGGDDFYKGGCCVVAGSRREDSAWVAGSLGAGIGIDILSPVPPHELDLAAHFVAPQNEFEAAPESDIPFVVRVENRGDVDALAVHGLLTISNRYDEQGETPIFARIPVEVGDVAAGEEVLQTVTWPSAAQADPVPRLQAVFELVAVQDAEKTNDADHIDFELVAHPDARVLELTSTKSGLVGSNVPFPVHVQLGNYGNIPYNPVPLTVAILTLEGAVINETVRDVFLPSTSGAYDPTNLPVLRDVNFTFTSPPADGSYVILASIPSTSEFNLGCDDGETAPACLTATTKVQPLEVMSSVDIAVSVERGQRLADPLFFEGLTFRVANLGTVPADFVLSVQTSALGHVETVPIPLTLQADSFTLVKSPPFPFPPLHGQERSFTASVDIDDADSNNDAVEFIIKFRDGVIYGDDFEHKAANAVSTGCGSGEALWEQGVPGVTSGPLVKLEAKSGKKVWATGLIGSDTDGACANLDFTGIDFGQYLDPYFEFWGASDILTFSPPYAYSGGYVETSRAGKGSYRQVTELDPGYNCNMFDGVTGAFCGASGWTLYRGELQEYEGQKVDLRFHYYTYPCCNSNSGWFIDDLAVFGTRRFSDDLHALDIKPPLPLLQNELATLGVEVRNNGFQPIDLNAHVQIRVGTGAVVFETDLERKDAPPGTRTLLEFPWTPTAAKRYLMTVTLSTDGGVVDPRPANNVIEETLDVYQPYYLNDFEAGACCDAWTHDGNPDEWQLGSPSDYPGSAYSGQRAFATDLTGPYEEGYYDPPDTRLETLYTPELELPEGGHTGAGAFIPGDQYVLSFRHAYETHKQLFSPSDLAYVIAERNGVLAPIAPDGGYPGESRFYPAFWDDEPPQNPSFAGWTGRSDGYESAFIPLVGAEAEDSYRFLFTLWSHEYSCFDAAGCDYAGWTIDDVMLLRAPRFDNDLEILSLSPAVLDAAKQQTIAIQVRNAGRLESLPSLLKLDVQFAGQPIRVNLPIYPIEAGEVAVVTHTFTAPSDTGLFAVRAEVVSPFEEWAVDNVLQTSVRLARVLYQNDFEETDGGWESTGHPKLQLGEPTHAPAAQGLRSWHTGKMYRGESVSLTGPRFAPRDPSGLTVPSVSFEGLVSFDGGDETMPCPKHGFRLYDLAAKRALPMEPFTLGHIEAFAGMGHNTASGHCASADATPFRVDLTDRQAPGKSFWPRFDAAADAVEGFCFEDCIMGENDGVQFDRFVLYGEPYARNLQLLEFVSPPSRLLGPGETATVSARVLNAGLGWPTKTPFLQFVSNDRAQGGKPSLDVVVPLERQAFTESQVVAVPWMVPPSLEEQIVRVTARLVSREGGKWVTLADQSAADNQLARSVSVIARHDLGVTAQSVPSVMEAGPVTTELRIQVLNQGTLTESGVDVDLHVEDADGATIATFPRQENLLVQPEASGEPLLFVHSFTPPSSGHYKIVARLDSPNLDLDAGPGDEVAEAWIHVGVLPYRSGDDFDNATEGWTATGGHRSYSGFKPTLSLDAPEGDHVLHSNPARAEYEPNARYSYERRFDVTGLAAPRLAFEHFADLGPGDQVAVSGSDDGGVTWTPLPVNGAPAITGQRDWSPGEASLAALERGPLRVRFELVANALGEGQGWAMDSLALMDGTSAVLVDGFESPLGSVVEHWDFETGSNEGWTSGGDYADWRRGVVTSGLGAYESEKAWKTGLDDGYTESPGHRLLTSPPISVPADVGSAALGFWHNYEMQYGGCYFSCGEELEYRDSGVVLVSVDGGEPQVIEPVTGYPNGAPGSAGHDRAFNLKSGGWRYEVFDLSAYRGRDVQFTFDLSVPSGFFYYGRTGYSVGWTIDDVTLWAKSAAEVLDDNVRLEGVEMGILDDYAQNTVAIRAYNEAPASQTSVIDWRWTGSRGAVLGAGTLDAELEPGLNEIPLTLPMVSKVQQAILWLKVTAPGDQRPGDDVLTLPAPVQQVLLSEDFDGVGSPCGANPCLGWTHGSDEWEHGTVPASRFPGRAYSEPYVYGLDLTPGGDGNTEYEMGASASLLGPAITVPPTGGTLRFRHALEAPTYFYWDAAWVTLGGLKASPIGGYPTYCGYPVYSNCFTGSFGWTEAEFDLGPFAGQTVAPGFRFVSDDWMMTGAGWTLDDVTAVANLPAVGEDLNLFAPEVLALDREYDPAFDVQVHNLGTSPSAPMKLVASLYRDGGHLEDRSYNVPAVAPDEPWTLRFTMPEGPAEGVVIDLSLLPRAGGRADENPTNDHRRVTIRPVQALLWEPFDDRTLPIDQPLVDTGAFRVAKSPLAGQAPSALALVAGFNEDPIARGHAAYFSVNRVPHDAVLEFDHTWRFPDDAGASVQASYDGGSTWATLDPAGGYPDTADCPDELTAERCFGGDPQNWMHSVFPLDDAPGRSLLLRFRYGHQTLPAADTGWAIDNFRLHGTGTGDAWIEAPRWQRGQILNDLGPLEATSLPNAFGIGLQGPVDRAEAHDVLLGPAIDLTRIPSPQIGFDAWASFLSGALRTQVLDRAGNWLDVDRITVAQGGWERRTLPLERLGDATRVRFIFETPLGLVDPDPGVFIDNVLVGSLAARLERADALLVEKYEALDGTNVTVPVTVTNTGLFTDAYSFGVRGPTAEWFGTGTPASVRLEPGESRTVQVRVRVPYGGDEGGTNFAILAQSLFDPLHQTTVMVPITVKVSPRPDWRIVEVAIPGSTLNAGEWHVSDAANYPVLVTLQNQGPGDSEARPRVQFLEHVVTTTASGESYTEVRSFNETILERLPSHSAPDTPYIKITNWVPRKGVEALEIRVNPGDEIPEAMRGGNSEIRAIHVEPRALPELVFADDPQFSRVPEVGEQTLVGVDVKNVGLLPTVNPVDVAFTAGYDHATLTSPMLNLPGNDVARVTYASDLEINVDAVRLEARVPGGEWTILEPIGDYPHGCVLSFDCDGGISGATDGFTRTLTFRLRPLQGPAELRLVFGQDPSNGRHYDGFTLDRVQVRHHTETVRDFDFGRGAQGWTPTHTWQYRAPQGPIVGGWIIPPAYANPFTVGIRTVPGGECDPCLSVGALSHAEFPWQPATAGDIGIEVWIDSHNLEPEFGEDVNRRTLLQRVSVYGLDVHLAAPAELVNATARGAFPLVMRNDGNRPVVFDVVLRDHPSFTAQIEQDQRLIRSVLLDPGQEIRPKLVVAADSAPAGAHVLHLDLIDPIDGRRSTFQLPVVVKVGLAQPLVLGATVFTIRQQDQQTLVVENPSNGVLPVVLRIGGKPSGLAARLSPDEFSLAPFERRSVEVSFVNLGVASGDYALRLINAAQTCPASAPKCDTLSDLRVRVLPYTPPEASILAPEGAVRPGENVTLRSGDAVDGVTYAWTFGDGTASAEASPTHAWTRPGLYEVRLTVTDRDGLSARATPVFLAVSNLPPKAMGTFTVGPGQSEPMVGRPVNFTAADSFDDQGVLANVTWAFGDGNLANGVETSHTYARAATYRVTVAVEDLFGEISVGFLSVEVKEAPEAARPQAESDSDGASVPAPSAAFALLAVGLLFWSRRRPPRSKETLNSEQGPFSLPGRAAAQQASLGVVQ